MAAGNRVTAGGGFTYTYDNEGNLSSKTDTSNGKVTTYTYDQRDRLAGVTEKTSGGTVDFQATYTYDALDRRIGENTDADGAGAAPSVQSWHAYDGDDTYADFDSGGAIAERYLHALSTDFLIARTDSSAVSAFYLVDRVGSVRAIANTTGGLVYTTGYDSFGKKVSESGSGGDRWGYSGREHDAGTGLRYHRARYFSSELYRWSQEDPIGFDGGDGNIYRYVGNSPTNFTDPDGLQKQGPSRPNKPRGPLDYLPTPAPPSKGDQLGKIPVLRPGDPAYTKPGPGMGRIPVLGGNGYIGTIPPNTTVGITGAGPCVGLILIPKNPTVDPTYVFHFDAKDDPVWTLYREAPLIKRPSPFSPIGIPYNDKGYTGIISGGNTVEGGNEALRTLYETMKACRVEGIPIKGYVPAPDVDVDGKGNIYWTTPPTIPLIGYEP